MKIDNSRPIRSLNDIFNDPAADELLIKPKKNRLLMIQKLKNSKKLRTG